MGACDTTAAVEISTGEFFIRAMKLTIFKRISLDHPYDVIFGRDWFNLCSIGLEGNSDAAVCLLTSNQQVIYTASPVNAIHFSTQCKLLSFGIFHFTVGCFFEPLTSFYNLLVIFICFPRTM